MQNLTENKNKINIMKKIVPIYTSVFKSTPTPKSFKNAEIDIYVRKNL